MVSPMHGISANLFNGRSARRYPCQLDVRNGRLYIITSDDMRSLPLSQVRLSEPFAAAPAMLRLRNGAVCEVAPGEGRDALLAALGYRKSRVERWQQHWPGALVSLVVLIALLALAYLRGVPWAADRVADHLPASVETQLGKLTLDGLLAQRVLQPSRLGAARIAEVQALLPLALPPQPRLPVRILVRDSAIGPNAFALPDGTIVVTDMMVQMLQTTHGTLDDKGKAQLLGVLGHEIGHLERRHSTRVLARSSLAAALSAGLFGDFSAIAASAPTLLARMAYSREMELEADDYAIGVLRRNELSPLFLAESLQELERVHRHGADTPRWLRTTSNYLSTHPDTTERIARIRAAAGVH